MLKGAGTIVWNGPVGVFEFDQFGEGTRVLAQAVARSPAFSIAGGGDTIAAIEKYGIGQDISYISTAGGAFLEFLEGKKLPAVEMLEQRAARCLRCFAAPRSLRHWARPRTRRACSRTSSAAARMSFASIFPTAAPRITRSASTGARRAAADVGKHVAVLGDLQGPKIRIERFADGRTVLTEGEPFVLDPDLDSDDGTDRAVGMTYPDLAKDVASRRRADPRRRPDRDGRDGRATAPGSNAA